MEPDEFPTMDRAEEAHWWYLGLRDLLARLLPARISTTRPRVLDAGCGTGANLRLLRDRLRPSYLGGFDLAPEALSRAARKVPEAQLYRSDVCDPQLPVDALDLILCTDVIYVPGAARARPGLVRLAQALAPGGLLALQVPAYRWLASEHDAAVHGSERFTAAQIRSLLVGLGLELELLTYRLALLLPLVAVDRLPRMGTRRRGVAPRSDLQRPIHPRLARGLFAVLRAENAAIARGARLPFGSSVFALARRDAAGRGVSSRAR